MKISRYKNTPYRLMALFREYPEQHDSQHDGPHGDMCAVKPRQHEKGGAVYSRSQVQTQLGVSMHVLDDLKRQEGRAQTDGNGQPGA